MNITPSIRPELVAAKLAAIKNYEQPEMLDQILKTPCLVELLWFLQAMSLQPGGLNKFVVDFLDAFPAQIGTAAMFKNDCQKKAEYSFAQCREIWCELPQYAKAKIWAADVWAYDLILMESDSESEARIKANEAGLEKAIQALNYPALKDMCRATALEKLPDYLVSFCTNPAEPFNGCKTGMLENGDGRHSLFFKTWYFQDLLSSLLEMMEVHAKKASGKLAMTEVALKVFDALNYAWEEKAMVQIEGDSRFGKTEAVQAWCNMFPGKARLVQVPCSNSDADLYKAIAEALGLGRPFSEYPKN